MAPRIQPTEDVQLQHELRAVIAKFLLIEYTSCASRRDRELAVEDLARVVGIDPTQADVAFEAGSLLDVLGR